LRRFFKKVSAGRHIPPPTIGGTLHEPEGRLQAVIEARINTRMRETVPLAPRTP
jgi:hypothetical protein